MLNTPRGKFAERIVGSLVLNTPQGKLVEKIVGSLVLNTPQGKFVERIVGSLVLNTPQGKFVVKIVGGLLLNTPQGTSSAGERRDRDRLNVLRLRLHRLQLAAGCSAHHPRRHRRNPAGLFGVRWA